MGVPDGVCEKVGVPLNVGVEVLVDESVIDTVGVGVFVNVDEAPVVGEFVGEPQRIVTEAESETGASLSPFT